MHNASWGQICDIKSESVRNKKVSMTMILAFLTVFNMFDSVKLTLFDSFDS